MATHPYQQQRREFIPTCMDNCRCLLRNLPSQSRGLSVLHKHCMLRSRLELCGWSCLTDDDVCCRYELGYRAEFLWQGTSDFTAWLAAPACLALQRALQPERITSYNHSLVKEATSMLQQAWGTQLALGIAPDGSTAGLVAIQLPWPLHIPSSGDDRSSSSSSTVAKVHVAVNGVKAGSEESAGGPTGSQGPTPADAARLNLFLREQCSIEVPVACVAGMLFTRISAQIYNNMSDYERLRDAVLQLRLS